MNFENSSLVLKHSDLSLENIGTATVINGGWSNGKGKTTWRVNLRRLLGDVVYDEYSVFALRLNQLCHTGITEFSKADQDKQVVLQMTGLNFLNSTYSVKTGNNTNKYHMIALDILDTSQSFEYAPNISMCSFKKGEENVEITIELIRTVDGLPAEFNSLDVNYFPSFVYNFDII